VNLSDLSPVYYLYPKGFSAVTCYFSVAEGSIVMIVSLSLCLSVYTHSLKPHDLTLPGFLCMLPVAVAWSSSVSVSIRFVDDVSFVHNAHE